VLFTAGAGAGLAAVYDVPLAGTLLALLALGPLASSTLPVVVVVSIACAAATVVAWPVVGTQALYAVPPVHLDGRLLVWAVVAAPLCAVVARVLDGLSHRAMARAPGPTWRLPVAATAAMALVGVCAVWLPSLPGNGKGLVELALRPGTTTGATFVLLLLLKVALTALCFRGGLVGGLITPALAVGAALGAAGGLLGPEAGPASGIAAYALVAGAGTLAVSQRSVLFALALVWELTRVPWQVAAVCAGTALLARSLDRAARRLHGKVCP
jgi:H+/Cl- antiporter ClcA